jgi:hypothetical protein
VYARSPVVSYSVIEGVRPPGVRKEHDGYALPGSGDKEWRLGLARTMHVHGIYTVFLAMRFDQIYGVCARFWPTLVEVDCTVRLNNSVTSSASKHS